MTVTLHPAHTAAALAQETRKHPATRLREARLLQRLVVDGHGAPEIAAYSGLSEERVKQSLSLLTLPPAGQEAVESGRLPVDLALDIARLCEVNRRVIVARWIEGGFRDASHAARYVKAVRRDETMMSA
ncbi:hypothetical protein ACFY64_31840 [Streptomyces collinus]|uniref:hypothetical protein n=1 Tax=Streptomyces collinus TaxID=42684 RepID=UPI0036C23B16